MEEAGALRRGGERGLGRRLEPSSIGWNRRESPPPLGRRTTPVQGRALGGRVRVGGAPASCALADPASSAATRVSAAFLLPLPLHSFEMQPPRLGLAAALGRATRAAHRGAGERVAFGGFVPPFLLLRRPDFLFAAGFAGERDQQIRAAELKIGVAVAPRRRERGLVDRDFSARQRRLEGLAAP